MRVVSRYRSLAIGTLFLALGCGASEGPKPLIESPSTTVISGPRDASGQIDYEGALFAKDSRNAVEALLALPSTTRDLDTCDASAARSVESLLSSLSDDAVLRVGRHPLSGTVASNRLSSRLFLFVRLLSCRCEAPGRPAADRQASLFRLASLLSTSDERALYALHANALEATARCEHQALVARIDEPKRFAERLRLQAIAELIRRFAMERGIDINVALRTTNHGFDQVIEGRAPTLETKPSLFESLWMPFDKARERLSRAVATSFVRLFSDDFRAAKAAYLRSKPYREASATTVERDGTSR